MKAGDAAVQLQRVSIKTSKGWKAINGARRAGVPKSQAPAPQDFSVLNLERPRYKPPRHKRRFYHKTAKQRYHEEKQEQRKAPPPEVIAVTLTRYGLLRLAGLPKNGEYLNRLDAALDRLCEVVGYNNEAPDSSARHGGRTRLRR